MLVPLVRGRRACARGEAGEAARDGVEPRAHAASLPSRSCCRAHMACVLYHTSTGFADETALDRAVSRAAALA